MVGQLQRQHHVLEGRVAGQELERLEHEADLHCAQSCARVLVQREQIRAVDLDPAGARRVEAGENREQRRLARPGGADHRHRLNARISGGTTSGGRTRIKPALERNRPAIVILELGANDGLRGLPVAQMKKNLGAMIEQSQQAGARVLILGMRLPPNYGPDYKQAFEAAFGELAKRYQTALVPFFLEDVVKKPDLFQPDRIHPSVEAQPLILERVWTRLRPLLKSP